MSFSATNIQNLGQNSITQPIDLNARLYQASLPYSGQANAELIRYTATNFNLYNMPNHPSQPSVAVKEKILQLASATPKTISNYLDFSNLQMQDLVQIEKILTSFNQSYEIVHTPYNQTIGMLLPTLREYIAYKNSQGSSLQPTADKYAHVQNYSNQQFMQDFQLAITKVNAIANGYRLAQMDQVMIAKVEARAATLHNQYARFESSFDQNFQLIDPNDNEFKNLLLFFKDYIKSGAASQIYQS